MTNAHPSEEELCRWLSGRIAQYCHLNPAEVGTDRPWNEFGLQSRAAVALSGELEELLGRALSPTLAWEHPTIGKLARALVAEEERPAKVTGMQVTGEPVSADEPIAVIGIGCRFPGDAHGPANYWKLLLDGGSGISEVPPQRWSWFDDATPETAAVLARTTRWGGFLRDIAEFDAAFFGISPREADSMDPQQRILLETAIEALDHAGIAEKVVQGSRTGVFVGVCSSDYSHLTTGDLARVDAWTGTGAAASITANRLSYVLDLHGPSLVIDTACSSSLVAVHLACQSLRCGESEMALACGVNLILSPAVTINFGQAGVMAADGRCKSFDAAADGYVRSEGCGVVVLKPFSAALRDNDRVLAVIRGSAVRSDGRSNGLMAPSPQAQEELLRAAYTHAGVDPLDVDYVEAHGTGTALGDPIEAGALGAVLGADRPAHRPVLIGSVKSNLGHLEAAAGIAGLIKVVLALAYRRIPATLHYTVPNPRIAFAELGLRVTAEPVPWPQGKRPRVAGVSSFGFGGTNAHVVVAAAAGPSRPREGGVWVFSGQGSQWAGMGRRLLAEEPAFATAVGELEPGFVTEAGFSLRQTLAAGVEITGVGRVQPVLFGLQVALAALWRSYGVEPAAVIGHSMGEVAAAVVAGALTPADGLRVIVRRSRLLHTISGGGAMAVVESTENWAGLEVAAYQSPSQTIVAGGLDQVRALVEHLAGRGQFGKLIKVDVASHTARVDCLLPELMGQLADLTPSPPGIRYYSTVNVDTPAFDAAYWADNLRRPVRFTQAVATAIADGHTVFTEISPHPVLTEAIAETAGDKPVVVTATLRRNTQVFPLEHPHDRLTRLWCRTRHWVGPSRRNVSRTRPGPGTLLGERTTVATMPPTYLWQARLHPEALPYPQRHVLHGRDVTPASVLINSAWEAAGGAISQLRLLRPLDADTTHDVQVVAQGTTVRLVARKVSEEPGEWVEYLVADSASVGKPPPRDATRRCREHAGAPDASGGDGSQILDARDVTATLAAHGVDGAAYPWHLVELTRNEGLALAEVELPPDATAVHVLDAVLQLAPLVNPVSGGLQVPSTIGVAWRGGAPPGRVRIQVQQTASTTYDVGVVAPDGTDVMVLRDVRYARIDEAIAGEVRVYEVTWQPVQIDPAVQEHVLVMDAPGQGPHLDRAVAMCTTVRNELARLHHESTGRRRLRQRLRVITQGVRHGADHGLPQAVLWGLGQVAAAEHPEVWAEVLDIDPGRYHAAREGALPAHRLCPAPLCGTPLRERLTCHPDRTYLITGGLGALGLLTADHLARRGARWLVLVSRTPLPPRERWATLVDGEQRRRVDGVRALEAAGVTVHTVALDIADPDALGEWLTRREQQGAPPIRAAVHAAGVVVDRPLIELDDRTLRSVLRPKIGGAAALHTLFPPGRLDFLALFSSAGTLHGVPGQGAYAAANAYLDALAHVRARAGCPTISLNWGAWDGLGFAASGGGRLAVAALRDAGMRPLSVDEAFAAWDRAYQHGCAQALIIATDGNEEALPEPLRYPLSELPTTGTSQPEVPAWAELPAAERLRMLRDTVSELAASEMRLPLSCIDPDRPLAELGLDSVMSLAIRRRIQQVTGIQVGATLLWNHPTISTIAQYLCYLSDGSATRLDPVPASTGGELDDLLRVIEHGDHEGQRQ